jgi:hypothetical protein
MIKKQNKKISKLKKLWLVVGGVLLIAIGIISYPSFLTTPHPPNYDGYSKASLKMFYYACNIFWEEKGEDENCVAEELSKNTHGFSMEGNFSNIKLEGEGNKKTFHATAFHQKNARIFEINQDGEISLLIEMSDP